MSADQSSVIGAEDPSLAIAVRSIGKCYHVYERPMDRLKQALWRGRKEFFRQFWALRGVSFELHRGETLGIVGRNGSGKSTLLQMIAGTLTPSEGEVEVHGRVAALLELGSGFNAEFTGRENVYMNGAILGFSREEIDARFDRIAAFADIGDFVDQPVKTYSSGMVVRLAFAVQVQVEPDILIVDEALAVGDEAFQRKCFASIERIREKGSSVLFVSHAAGTVLELCDRAMLLESGERLLTGPPRTTVRQYQRLLYAPPHAQQTILEEIRSIDRSGGDDGGTGSDAPPLKDSEFSPAAEAVPASDGSVREGDYDEGFVTTATVVHPEAGARILDLQVRDRHGHRVNVLQPGRVYEIFYRVEFAEAAVGVSFGTHFRNVSGLELAGQRYPTTGTLIDLIPGGKTVELRFRFRMLLSPATYFVTAGVWASGGERCLHRVVDGYMIRVQPSVGGHSFGYADLAAGAPSMEVLDSAALPAMHV